MSHYFQQLLTSSGVVRPATIPQTAPTIPAMSAAIPEFGEITEERIAAPAASPAISEISHTPISQASPTLSVSTPVSKEVKIIGKQETAQSVSAPAKASQGVVEITNTHIAESSKAVTPSASTVAKTSIPPPAKSISVQPAAMEQKTTSMPAKPPVPAQAKSNSSKPTREQPAAVAGMPTRDELIEHVFRWVGQNPDNSTPSALNSSPPSASATSQPVKAARVPPPQPTPPSSTSAVTTSPAVIMPVVTEPAPVPSSRPRTPAPAAAQTQESSIEISIGTLQIQVEAPPAAAPKPIRRPVTPRAPSAPAPAAQRPAIDINRLRRGFYL